MLSVRRNIHSIEPCFCCRLCVIKEQQIGGNGSVGAEHGAGQSDNGVQVKLANELFLDVYLRIVQPEQEAIRLNLQQLKNQLNPHFLFNALNSLSALITTDPGVARKFILEMSKVYRYVLEKRKENLSKLEEEVEFIRHYYFLQKIRFGEQLNLHLADNLTTVNGRIPAMSLQLIFENALKYNEITHRYPLDIDIYAEVGAVIVENSYHPRTDMPEASFGVGMESIQEIYRYYADVQPEYEIKEGKFICRLPLVE